MAERIESLIDHMQYGHALIAFYKQDGTFKLVKATLIHYENEFHRNYEITRVTGTIIFGTWNNRHGEISNWRISGVETDMLKN